MTLVLRRKSPTRLRVMYAGRIVEFGKANDVLLKQPVGPAHVASCLLIEDLPLDGPPVHQMQ
jgi:hypothetical protein